MARGKRSTSLPAIINNNKKGKKVGHESDVKKRRLTRLSLKLMNKTLDDIDINEDIINKETDIKDINNLKRAPIRKSKSPIPSNIKGNRLIGVVDIESEIDGNILYQSNKIDLPYDIMLIDNDTNRYFIIQVIMKKIGEFFTFNKWGILDKIGSNQLFGPFKTSQEAIDIFLHHFEDKTGNKWDTIVDSAIDKSNENKTKRGRKSSSTKTKQKGFIKKDGKYDIFVQDQIQSTELSSITMNTLANNSNNDIISIIPSKNKLLLSKDKNICLDAATWFRKILSNGKNYPIDEVIQAGAVINLVNLMKQEKDHKIQFEAAWALTNIASGTSEQVKVVVDAGAIPIFIKLLSSKYDDIREQSIWAIANFAGESGIYRDLILTNGALPALLDGITKAKSPSALKDAIWSLYNICATKPTVDYNLIYPALPILVNEFKKDKNKNEEAC